MTGVGGGSLMTPLLVLLFGFHPATAVGTDLLYASVTKTVGHSRPRQAENRRLDNRQAPRLRQRARRHRDNFRHEPSGNTGRACLGSAEPHARHLASGDRPLGLLPSLDPELGRTSYPRPRRQAAARWTISLGAALGILVSVTSVGAGALGTTALLILYPRLPVARIAGSDIAHAVPLTLIAGIGHWLIGSVDFTLMLSLLAGSIPGVIVGSLLGGRTSDSALRPVLAITLLIVGASDADRLRCPLAKKRGGPGELPAP